MLRRFTRLLLLPILMTGGASALAAPASAANAATAGNVVVVLNSGDATISLIDPADYAVKQTYVVGKEPHHLMATPDNKSLIVANATGNQLTFLDPRTGQIQRQMRDVIDPYQIGFSPDQKWFVSAALRLDRVDIYRYEGGNLVLSKRVPLSKMPSHIAFDADSTTAFVTQQGNDRISAIDLSTQQIKWTMATGKLPAGVMMTPDNKYLLVGVMGRDYVEVIDWRTQKAVKRIVTGDGAHNFRALGDKRHIFVSNRVANTISILDVNTLENVGTIAAPGGPDCMEVTEDGQTMWVTLRWIKKVAVIDLNTRKLIKTIAVGRSPHGIYLQNRAAEM